jgi:hypothetical protein
MVWGVFSQVDVSDVCVGTSVGTITEPDCLGPCEPGTSVTLEGIVWNETEGGQYKTHSYFNNNLFETVSTKNIHLWKQFRCRIKKKNRSDCREKGIDLLF